MTRDDDTRTRLSALMGKGPPTLVLVDEPLAEGVIAEVHLNSPGPIARFLVVHRASLDDEVIDRAYSLAKLYEVHNPDDTSPVTFRLSANGDYVRISKVGEIRDHHEFHGIYSNTRKDRRSRWLLKSADSMAATDIPGVGPGRIISLGGHR